jgi:uncharacterized protein YjbI with pentapeptide repeats
MTEASEPAPPSPATTRPDPPVGSTVQPIPRWLVVIGVPVMVLAAVTAVALLLGLRVDAGKLDAIRTGGTLGVGLGGVVALWLAVRKQRATELDLVQKYEAHRLAELVAAHSQLVADRTAQHNEDAAAANRAHQERVADDSERDATARRITELYTKAIDQLGSDKAPVRLGGLYALERLGQDNADRRLRQMIVNVICAYLRLPKTTTADDARQESEVRVTAQRILCDHLKAHSGAQQSGSFWSSMDINLVGAELVDFDISECRIGGGNFTDAAFQGDFTCHEAMFDGKVLFDRAVFNNDASFSGADFRRRVWFRSSKFLAKVYFSKTSFSKGANFWTARFEEPASFGETVFGDAATFTKVEFSKEAYFLDVKFYGAWFEDANFGDRAWFLKSRFDSSAIFQRTRFCGRASFTSAHFPDRVNFDGARFERGVPSELAFWFPQASNE